MRAFRVLIGAVALFGVFAFVQWSIEDQEGGPFKWAPVQNGGWVEVKGR